jgi:hypothetical protein
MEHAVDLAAAVDEDRASYGFTLVPSGSEMRGYVATQLARRGLTPFAQIRVRDGKAVRCTGFVDPRSWPDQPALRAVEIGFTWLAASAQGSGINAEAKFLLLGYAFETMGVARVDLKTDAATTGAGGRWSDVVSALRLSFATGRCPGRPARRRCCETRRCSRWSHPNGRLSGKPS